MIHIERLATLSYYSLHYKRHRTTTKQFIHQITNLNSNYFAANSIIKKHWFRPNTQILLLDCDTTEKMLAACNTLHSLNIPYAITQSSPGKYWIITNKIGPFKELHDLAKSIPGIDRDYLNNCIKWGTFALRLTPIDGKQAIFPNSHHLTGPALKWYNEFKALWESEPMTRRYRAEILKQKLNNGTILEAAANPEFRL